MKANGLAEIVGSHPARTLTTRPGRPGALLRPAPLRDRTCTFPCIRLKQAPWARWRAEVPGSCCCGIPPVAVSVQEAECSLVRCSISPQDDGVVDYRLAGDR